MVSQPSVTLSSSPRSTNTIVGSAAVDDQSREQRTSAELEICRDRTTPAGQLEGSTIQGRHGSLHMVRDLAPKITSQSTDYTSSSQHGFVVTAIREYLAASHDYIRL